MRIRRIVLAIILMFTFLIGSLPVLNVEAKNGEIINNTNGLISSCVNDVCQTSDGFIWIAQYEGLTKYDGGYYQLVQDIQVGDKKIRLDQITNVENDENNRLYIGTKRYGLVVYENGVFSFKSDARGKNISDIFTSEDVAYVATTEGAYIYKNDTIAWIEDTLDKNILSITAKGEDVYYSVSGDAVYKYNKTSELIYKAGKIKKVRAFGDNVYLGDDNGKLICIGDDATTEYSVGKPINALCIQKGVLVIGSDGGVYKLENNSVARIKELERYTGINSLIFDYEGGLWLATSVGLVELHRYGVKNLFQYYNIEESLTNACIYYKGKLYVGLETGIIIIDENTDSIITNTLTTSLAGVRIRDLAVVSNELYVATYNSSTYDVLVYDGENIRNISAVDMLGDTSTGISDHGKVRCLANFKDGLIIGTNYGLTLMYNSQYKTIPMKFRPLSITVGQNGIYVCTDGNGISVVDFEKNEEVTLPGTEKETILKVIEYEDGLLYAIGTSLYYYKDGVVTDIKSPNNGSIVDLIEFPKELVVLTGSGMLVLDKETLLNDEIVVIKKLTAANGLESGVTANGRAYYSAEKDAMYLNCQSGIYVYNFTKNTGDKAAPRLVITDFIVDDKNITVEDTIKLNSHANRIEIKLSIPTFMNRENMKVYYQLEGVDKKLIEMDFDRGNNIEYTNVKGGEYTLRMYAVNEEGTRSNEIVVNIDKDLRWVDKWSSRIFIFVFDTAIIVGFVMIISRNKMKKERLKAERNKRITEESLEAIAGAIDAKDSYTNGHSIRVAKFSECIGKHLGMSKTDLENLYYIGLMHDVGKIGIPDRILNKPGRLTNDEFSVMKEHPEIGYSILHSIHSIPHLEEGVLYHHEKYDGTGYPNRLKGDSIPTIGKIIACADAYDAMATRRCYKEQMSNDVIIAEFERCRDKQFDGHLVDIVISCINNGDFEEIMDRWYFKAPTPTNEESPTLNK